LTPTAKRKGFDHPGNVGRVEKKNLGKVRIFICGR